MQEEVTEALDAEETGSDLAKDTQEPAPEESDGSVNYEQLMKEDLAELSKEFPELSEIKDVTELENPIRYAALRDLGLTPAEAYLATARKKRAADTRSHLYSSVPGASSLPRGTMSERELTAARELFPGVSDSEIRKLYKTVTR